MKKSIFKFLALSMSMLFLGVFTTNTYAITPSKNFTFSGDTIINLSENGEELQYDKSNLLDKISESNIIINNIDYSFPKIIIEGEVDYKNGEGITPFKLSGDFKNRGTDGDNFVILDLIDDYDNFEVVHSSIVDPIKKINLFDKNKLKEKNTKYLFRLYMLDKKTRNFTSVEVINPTLFDNKELFNKMDLLDKADKEDILWHSKLLKISGKTVLEEPNLRLLSDMGQKEAPIDYYYYYTYWDIDYKEEIHGIVQLEFPESIGAEAEGKARITVNSKKTTYLDGSGEFYNDSFLSIGRGGDTKIKVGLGGTNYEGFSTSSANGLSEELPFVSLSTDVSYSILSLGPVDLSANLSFGGTKDYNESYTDYFNSVSKNEYTRLIEHKFKKGLYLDDPNQYFVVNFKVNDYQGNTSSNEISAKFDFYIYTNFDGYSTPKSKILKIDYEEI